jgi:CRISPR-associated endonuclease/helicase Cas3
MDFGLLNQDALWVLDEVQLMDVGLATSGQLQAFRSDVGDAGAHARPCHSWWMSATLQRAWLEKSPETEAFAGDLPQTSIPERARKGHLWDDVKKPIEVEKVADAKALARLVVRARLDAGDVRAGPTLVVVNTVDLAVGVHEALRKDKALQGVDLRLVHSRFRPHERARWRAEFLNRAACSPGTNRIVVATQVIEAGVDISAGVLITELCPWPSLVQRFGRAARWGGSARVVVFDRSPKDDKAAAPYAKEAIDASRDALHHVADGSPLGLETFEEAHADLLAGLYPYSPKHLLLPHELQDLFDTTPDLTGADIDVSRFIRSGDERDVQVFWQELEKGLEPERRLRPSREALCSVPFLKARDWLCGTESKSAKSPRLKAGTRAWVWDWLDGNWQVATRKDLYPGQTVLVASSCGGYDESVGWDPTIKKRVPDVAPAEPSQEEQADAAQDDEHLSAASAWQTIAVHGRQVGGSAAALAHSLVPEAEKLFDLAGRWHDAGKAHRVFQASIRGAERPARRDLAKAPENAWLSPRKLYPDGNGRRRVGFRHELASTARLFTVLIDHAPDHPALLGPWRDLFGAMGVARDAGGRAATPNVLEREIMALTAEEFDLVAYLVCAHHGKVRFAWHAAPADQEAADDVLRIRGVRDGETLPAVLLASSDGEFVSLTEAPLTLAPAGVGLSPVTGRAWTDRVLGLLKRHSPFRLAYFEALLRAADIRASRAPVADDLLEGTESSGRDRE